MRWIIVALPLAALAGCNTATPYPNGSPIAGARVSANPYQPGTDRYCREYARQTAANDYQGRVDRSEDSFGARAIKAQSARRDGGRAYRRCLARGR
ncbi:hypothetical protein [Jiella marina]|uniref:hypothetical protein n=1 Tax=Jiella sp. LLJ827 TaxID=2917712 RepID=UPI00210151F1|nr:hypothetical protein [Jiella sp. LLJ827]MCQ0989479.1 hypothetical protein [Jiella sp. LLJ827]